MSVLLGVICYLAAASIVTTILYLNNSGPPDSSELVLFSALGMFWPVLGLYGLIAAPGWLITRWMYRDRRVKR